MTTARMPQLTPLWRLAYAIPTASMLSLRMSSLGTAFARGRIRGPRYFTNLITKLNAAFGKDNLAISTFASMKALMGSRRCLECQCHQGGRRQERIETIIAALERHSKSVMQAQNGALVANAGVKDRPIALPHG
jgi:hypothetical protein